MDNLEWYMERGPFDCHDCGDIVCVCYFETCELLALKEDVLEGHHLAKITLSILAGQASLKADPFEKVEIQRIRDTVVMKDQRPDDITLLRWIALALESPKEKMKND